MSVVTGRPLPNSDLSYFDLCGTPDVDSFNFFGFRTPHRARAAFAEDRLLSPESSMLLVADQPRACVA